MNRKGGIIPDTDVMWRRIGQEPDKPCVTISQAMVIVNNAIAQEHSSICLHIIPQLAEAFANQQRSQGHIVKIVAPYPFSDMCRYVQITFK